MRIKKLEIVGFKSFLEPTVFDFRAGITGIVGPNGCGKSNVVDAIKWATGELSYKELRGRSMQDLIFAGSEKRPPTGMAEVSLTFDANDGSVPEQYRGFSEINVVRRIFRDGTSEFFINRVPCRLRDVIDLFLDTGAGQGSYSVIEQGRVGAIISSKPESRREIIEEAAGVMKYKHRKKAAVRKMEFTRQNLLRVGDVLLELKRQIGSLGRQAGAARRFQILREECRKLDLSLSAKQYAVLVAETSRLSREDRDNACAVEQVHAELSVRESRLETRRLAALDAEKVLARAQEDLFSASSRASELESRVSGLRRESEMLRSRSAEEKDRSSRMSAEGDRIESERRGLDGRLNEFREERDSVLSGLEDVVSREVMIRSRISAVEAGLDHLKEDLLEAVVRETQARQLAESHKRSIAHIDVRLEERARESEEARDEVARLAAVFLETQAELGSLWARKEALEREEAAICRVLDEGEGRLASAEAEASAIDQRLEGARARLAALDEFEQSCQGYGPGVQALMQGRQAGREELSGVSEPVSRSLRPSEGFERAVEAVLAERVGCLLVDDAQTALAGIRFLKACGVGRGSFLLKNAAVTVRSAPEGPGIRGPLIDFVECRGEDAAALGALMSDVYVVDSVEDALRHSKIRPEAVFVTPDGDMVSPPGVVTGGTWGAQQGVFEILRGIENLREKIENLGLQRIREASRIRRARREVEARSRCRAEVGVLRAAAASAFVEGEKRFARVEETLRYAREKLDVVGRESYNLRLERDALSSSVMEASSAAEAAGQSRGELEKSVALCSSEAEGDRDRLRDVQEELTKARIREASLSERMDAVDREIRALAERLEGTRSEASALWESAAENADRAEVAERQARDVEAMRLEAVTDHTALERRRDELRVVFDGENGSIVSDEAEMRSLRQKAVSAAEDLNALRLRLREETLRAEHLSAQAAERYGVSLDRHMAEDDFAELPDSAVDSVREKLTRLRERMTAIGDVNLAAIDELRQLKERFDFLTAQKDDLERTLDALSAAIRKINATTRERFAETFEAINARFESIFPRLFRGGRAKLILVDPENLLETGVDIMVQPRGKRLQNMGLLSGGEKALTAIALLFAIFDYKAPPFCVLDEVDAPLDDENIRRFLSLLKDTSERMQFVIITHNKLSMEVTRNLYGITMEEPGVSRTVSVRLIPGEAGVERETEAVLSVA